MEDLEMQYCDLSDALTMIIHKAYLYDLEKQKRAAGGRKSSANMTAEERSARARKAALARFKKGNL